MRRRYTIIERLGSGGMSSVYRARREGPAGFSKEVALKVAASDIEEDDALALLTDEARALGVIRHRSIVQTDGVIRLGGMWALVMEYVEGAGLDALRGTGTLPLRATLSLVAEVAGALHVAQNAATPRYGSRLSLTHRDIKPANLMLTPGGDVKLLDFGIALSSLGSHSTRALGGNDGSAPYMSPERLRAIDGPEADVYALGAVFYELLTGELFGRTVANQRAHDQRLEQADTALMGSEAATCEGLAALVLSMLAYDPAARPSARAVERRCHEWAAITPGVSLRDYAEVSVSRELANRPSQRSDIGLDPGVVLHEESFDPAGPLMPAWTPSTPSSGGLGLAVDATPAVSPMAIVRALVAQDDPDTVERVRRTYGPDTGALDDEAWLEDIGMMRYLAYFAGISLLIALGLFIFVMTQVYGWAR